jgi:hypothetical protein
MRPLNHLIRCSPNRKSTSLSPIIVSFSFTYRGILPKRDIHFSAITFEYLKTEIVNISKPYLENLPYK